MDIKELAVAFTNLLREGKDREAAEQFWAEDVVSLEAMEGPHARVQGKEAIFAKFDWWENAMTMHEVKTDGPHIHGDQFAIHYWMDVTNNESGEREQMSEVGLYTVKDGKIVEERFFYMMP